MKTTIDPDRQICLAIDTALNACSLALAIREKADAPLILLENSCVMERGHAESLMGQMQALMKEGDIDYSDLTRLAVTIGPGSFTGLRVGLASAKALSLALDIPLIGLSSLKALELTAREQSDQEVICTAIDARRQQIYFQLFDRSIPSQPLALSLEECMQTLASVKNMALIGSAAEMIRGNLSEQDEEAEKGPRTELLSPQVADAKLIAQWALDQPISQESPSPLYLRAPDAKPQTGKAIARA